jgi:hypothetical protein
MEAPMRATQFLRAATLAAFAFGAVACGAADDGSEASDVSQLNGAGGDARDVEADPESPGQRDQYASLLAANLDPESGTSSQSYSATTDADKDGIADALEEELLHRYRPYYRFSKSGSSDETYRPADPVTELTFSQLRQQTGDDGVSDPLAGCGRSGDHHLDPASQLFTCKPDTNFQIAKAKKNYCLNIDDSRYGGVPFAQAKTDATGLLGHVVNDTVNGHAAYKIEYWQFFAFNNQDITFLGLGSFGDHEGDWTSVQLWFDRTLSKIVKVEYLIHGKSITFNIPATATPTCKSCFQTVKGSQWNITNLGNFFDTNERAKYQDNQAEFFIDANGYRHVVVYIERGAHEFWPGPWGHAEIDIGPETIHLNPHNGQGTQYLVPDITTRPFNAGEVDHPLTANARIVLNYDAYWGCTNTKDLFGLGPERRSPIGPAIHCEWKWPTGGSVAACEH